MLSLSPLDCDPLDSPCILIAGYDGAGLRGAARGVGAPVIFQAKRIWLNLELIKRPPRCLEYVVVHELVHLHERYHNARFWGFMDQFMPDWRTHKAELSRVTLGPAAGADAD